MKLCNAFVFTILVFFIVSCEDKKPGERFFSVNASALTKTFTVNEQAVVGVNNDRNQDIDSVVYFFNEVRIGSDEGAEMRKIPLKDAAFGYHFIKIHVFHDGHSKPEELTQRIEVVSHIEPALYDYELVKTYEHDANSFTQGLEFYRDTLYETTGQNGNSYLRKLDFETGRVYKQANLEQQYFGEGMTVLNHKLYYLTWRSQLGFIYNPDTLERVQSFAYSKPIEGWGITNDGQFLYQSDGTEKIWRMDPESLKLLDYVNVYSPSGKIKSVNELEWIDGKIYGNVWMRDAIAIIDPKTGAVEGIVNFADLRKQLKSPTAEVLNGIAYHPVRKTIFVTGKFWDKLFEVKIKPAK